jgi:hypothetical protein
MDLAPEFVAHSRPKPGAIVVPSALAAFFAYAGLTAFNSNLPWVAIWTLRRPSMGIGVALLALAALFCCVAVWQLRRWLRPSIDFVADAQGLACSQVFWSSGRMAWSDIERVEMAPAGVLHIFGTAQREGGKARRLTISAGHIDAPLKRLLSAMARHRPDLTERFLN